MAPIVLRWGIISTGGICADFVKDLRIDPKTRNVDDIEHKVVAVGSRNGAVDKAKEFIKKYADGDESIKACGTYEEVYANSDVDVIYIGTPHTLHYDNSLDAIKAGKHVLCEKPVTSNAAELKALLAAAKEHGVFFMEAMWTRFQPLSLAIIDLLASGELGKPVVVHADLSGDFDLENIPKTHRILDPTLGGGAILDLGPYPLVWAIMSLYEYPTNENTPPSKITGSIVKTPLTGVDANTAFTLNFNKLGAQAVLSCSTNLSMLEGDNPGAVIRCERGIIRVAAPIYVPKSFKVSVFGTGPGERNKIVREEEKMFDYIGRGMHFQADEVARCIREGRKESALWGHEKSLLEMAVFDEVRKQGGYALPPGVERVV
ncbi:GFO-IDH-MocA domain-containing protein [Mycena chlorophos]|uniref:D-xylose 1-dehydrogenase (NADP(+), D-xylono-1,5-lactone-forming) n=1 Tax=Mycena chlorophos TaxID=658473 RepID=A0A8H6TD59_MYCCL|nr:GFO-IDH-MocA domain-containing protein [Mycena chlorophos]